MKSGLVNQNTAPILLGMTEKVMATIRLLLIDDQPVFRRGLAVLLEESAKDIEVVGEASGTDEAISMVEQLTPDAIIMDIGMKNGKGVDFIRLMNDRFPRIKLLVLSSSEEQENLFQAIKAGASAYLLKSVGVKELAESIRMVMVGESVLAPSLISKLMLEFRNSNGEKASYVHRLTRREKDILQCAAQGCTNQEIAERCYVSLTTVKSHFRNIMKKLEVKNRTGAVAVANACGLLRDSPERVNTYSYEQRK